MKNDTARAVVFSAPGIIDIETVPVCTGEGIFLRSELIGISSGTEMLSYPIKYGYMNVGKTETGERRFAFYPHQEYAGIPRRRSAGGEVEQIRRLDFAVELLEKIQPSKYITHAYPLENAAFEQLDSKPEDTIQIVLKP